MKPDTRKKSVNNSNEPTKRYGLLSLMAMIIGIVVGAGIHTMNQGLVAQNGSIALSMTAWLIGAILVITMVVAFMEIISITEITGEQATLSNWSRRLIGKRTSNVIGYFMTFLYFPVVLGAFFKFGAYEIVETVSLFDGSSAAKWMETPSHEFLFITIVSIFFFFVITAINTFKFLPGKVFQDVGTSIKLIPLFFLAILFFVMVLIGDLNFAANQEYINNSPDYPHSTGITNSLGLIFLTLPAILFSIDGFAAAGGLSNEAKDKKTFKKAFVISMLFIIFMYILYSLAVYGLGDASGNIHGQEYGTIGNAIFATFGDTQFAFILTIILYVIITISILTAASGLTLGTARMISDLSAHNMIKDKNAGYLIRNKSGMSVKAGMTVLFAGMFWFLTYTTLDFVAVTQGSEMTFVSSNYGATLASIFAFLTYLVVISAAISNRFKKKAEVNKVKGFLPFATLSVILCSIIVAWFAFTTFFPYSIMTSSTEATSSDWANYIICMILFVIFIICNIVVNIVSVKRSNKLTEDEKYFKHLVSIEYYGEDLFEHEVKKFNYVELTELWLK